MGVNYNIANHSKKIWIDFSLLEEQNKIFSGKNGEFIGYLLQHIWNGDHVVLVSDMDNFFFELIESNVYENVTVDVIKEYNRICGEETFKIKKIETNNV